MLYCNTRSDPVFLKILESCSSGVIFDVKLNDVHVLPSISGGYS